MIEVFSPATIKVGEFDPDIAVALAQAIPGLANLDAYFPIQDPGRLDFLQAIGVELDQDVAPIRTEDFDPAVVIEPDKELIIKDYEKYAPTRWHIDFDSDQQCTLGFLLGCTQRNPILATGRLVIAREAETRTVDREYKDFLLEEEGQDAVNEALKKGDLSLQEEFEPGDILFLPRGALHARAQTPEAERMKEPRVTIKQFENYKFQPSR